MHLNERIREIHAFAARFMGFVPYLIGLGLVLLLLTFIPVIGQFAAVIVLIAIILIVYHALRGK